MLEYETLPFPLLPMHYICPPGVFTTMKKNEAGHSPNATAFLNIYLKNSFKISSGSVDIHLRDRQKMKEEGRAKRHYWGIHLNWEMSKITSEYPKLCTWETKDKEFEELGT